MLWAVPHNNTDGGILTDLTMDLCSTKSESSSPSSAESDSSSHSTTSLEYESSSFESGGSFSHDEVHPFTYKPILGSTNTNRDRY